MRRGLCLGAFIAATVTPAAAYAGMSNVLQPLQLGSEAIRFDRGDYVVDMAGKQAAVQVRSAPDVGGNMSFEVSVLNTSRDRFNINVSNIRVDGVKGAVRLLTRAEMEHKAENHARWTKILTSVSGGLVAVAQAGQRDYYHVNTSTPYGHISTSISAPCYSCRADARGTLLFTGARLDQIQNKLDETRSALGEQALQLTTVDPGRAYGGRIYLSSFKPEPMTEMRLVVTVNGEPFVFGFRFAPPGTPLPAYRLTASPSPTPPSGYQSIAALASVPPALPSSSGIQQTLAVAHTGSTSLPASFGAVAAVPISGATTATRIKWQRYYDSLLATGVSTNQAKAMANEEFGSLN